MNNFSPKYGVAEVISPLIRRVTANNPAPFTYKGTGTYIIGHGSVAIIDPGPRIQAHIDAILEAVKEETISHILVTHNHLDHSPASIDIAYATGAKIYAYDVAEQKYTETPSEEGIDHSFKPDIVINSGNIISGDDWTLEVVHTPGHLSNHLCFALKEENALFSGDHVMGWSSSIISPPDGNMQDYLNSLQILMKRNDDIYYPTHGAPITNPKKYVQGLIDHRLKRDDQIIAEIKAGHRTIPEMVKVIYTNLPTFLRKAAERSVYAHLIRLNELGVVETENGFSEESKFSLKN